jgi:hypothetical protein
LSPVHLFWIGVEQVFCWVAAAVELWRPAIFAGLGDGGIVGAVLLGIHFSSRFYLGDLVSAWGKACCLM